ncbi:MAG: protein kinase, partial [Gemmatimonadetes bacterium]|nr:protein kinase [Gemmatimonadota bacterium]
SAPSEPSDADTLQRLTRALGQQYEVHGLVGRGGFAEVYEVWDKSLERRLAVKVLRPDAAWTAGMLARFRDEARAVAKLTHANILPIHFVGEVEGIIYYAMPYVEGRSLGDTLRSDGALEPDHALAIARPVLEALQHAHEKGLIHRDIKPDNIMIEKTSGRPLRVDFGIAKRMEAGKGLTQTGFVVGTPHYMSPEQALGQGDLDSRTDIYAMGAVLFQMVTGAPPFDGDTSQEIVAQHITQPPPLATAVNAKIPKWVSDVIVRCMAKRPADRYPSATDVAQALARGRASGAQQAVSAVRVAQAVQSGEPTVAVPSGERPAARPSAPTVPMPMPTEPASVPLAAGSARGRGRRWVIGAAVGLLAAGGAGAYYLSGRPALAIENRLVEPVAVAFNADPPRTVDPGATGHFPLPRARAPVVRWRLIRPTMPGGAALGAELTGTIQPGRVRGAVQHAVDASVTDRPYFAPLITNASDRPLTVTVNAGLQGATSCACWIQPGASRVRIGYFPLFQNSTVRVHDQQGRWAMFTDLGPKVDPASGAVGLRFETADLRR